MTITLGSTYDNIKGGMAQVEGDLTSTLATLGDASSLSVTDMVGLQFRMSSYTVAAGAISSTMKEIADAIKQVIQRVS